MLLMARSKKKSVVQSQQGQTPSYRDVEPNTHIAVEWMGPKEGERNVKIKFDEERKKIHVSDRSKRPLRMIDLRHITGSDSTHRPLTVHLRLSNNNNQNLMSIRVPGEIDLVLKFLQKDYRTEVVDALNDFLHKINVRLEHHDMAEAIILKDAETKEQRKKLLDQFFRIVCLQAFNNSTEADGLKKLDAKTANKIAHIQLTRTEFAEALGLKPSSEFVKNMCLMVDKDGNGFVGFREFLGMFTILAQGGANEKAILLFNMYDLRGQGEMTSEQFTEMIKSMLDLSDTSLDNNDLNKLVSELYGMANLKVNENMTINAFKKIFASGPYERVLEMGMQARLPGQKDRQSLEKSFCNKRSHLQSFYCGPPIDGNKVVMSESYIAITTQQKEKPKSRLHKRWYSFSKYVENYRRQIFWVTLYVLISIGIFVERAYYYSVEREQYGLRRLAGFGVSATRGAAAGMMWTYSCLLITMARNTITFLRETFLHQFIPFDSFHTMHKLIAIEALIFTLIHVIGHAINFYHIATWPSIDLNCIFREYFRATDAFSSFHYWAWTTITGLTGIFLTLILIVMYVFAIPYARRHLFGTFWFTHAGYILVYILMIMHGSGRLVQSPLTQNYLIGPLAVFVLDKLVSFSRRKIEISVKKTELLPSDVLGLTFKRPGNFDYKSGQWVQISCLELGSSEYHPFTLTSAPHEEHLSLHIRAVGPWTKNMRQTYDVNNRNGKPFPKLYIDGPFGEGHQDWYRYKVAVLVGGGIGVTPFASILKDIVFTSKSSARRVPCEKIYFLWITRTQKHFEWLTDIIRDVERDDHKNLVSVHIFITQFQQKFDLRTTMLYICERHFQKISGKSLFTGLKATTHFGRPQFKDFFTSLHTEHPMVEQVGVFSCGPPPMTHQVDRACTAMNAYEHYPTFTHHFENF